MRLSDLLPLVAPTKFAAGCTRRILDQRPSMRLGQLDEGGQVAGHSDLMDSEDRSRLWPDRCRDAMRIDV